MKPRTMVHDRDMHVRVIDKHTEKLVYDHMLKLAPHYEAKKYGMVWKPWQLEPTHECRILLDGIRRQVRNVMDEMTRDGLNAIEEMQTVQADLHREIGMCMRCVAIYLELGGTGVATFGSIGLQYVERGKAYTWWMHGNGADKCAVWPPGTAAATLATDDALVLASNGKRYFYN